MLDPTIVSFCLTVLAFRLVSTTFCGIARPKSMILTFQPVASLRTSRLAGFPSRCRRAVFDLLWYQEMSQAEAAVLLGLAVPTVKLRWMKARLLVQQALGGAPFDEPGSLG